MLVNLPKKIVCSMVARELMKYFVQRDPEGNIPPIMCYMGDIDPDTGSVAMKYFPVEPNAAFLKYFKSDPDTPIERIPREIVQQFYTGSNDLAPGEITEYCKLVVTLDEVAQSTPCSISNYNPPIKIIDNSRNVEEAEN